MDCKNVDEQSYLDCLNRILNEGCKKPTRTGTPSISVTGVSLSFQLNRNDKLILPLLTTKLTSFRLVASELIWFLSGDTNSTNLKDTFGNGIWDANGSRKFLDENGFKEREEGDLGPIYGFQWRHWNGKYPHNAENLGIDQIRNVIQGIKSNPYGRRHIVSAWNPEQIPQMVLPPCHSLFQFVVRPGKDEKPRYLDCVVFQRSGDMPLGVPFNIASYALLTHMVANVTELISGALFLTIGDAHIYENQVEKCAIQVARAPLPFPSFEFKDKKQDIDDFSMQDFVVGDYKHHPKISYPLSA